MVFITSPSCRSPTRHWQNMHGMSKAAWAAFPNPLCQNCSNELLITPNAYLVGFCHFIRRQTCREVQGICSSLNYLYQSRILSAVSSVWSSEIQEKGLFFPLAVLTVIPHPLWCSRCCRHQHKEGSQERRKGTQQQGELCGYSSLSCLVGFLGSCRSLSSRRVTTTRKKKDEM